MSNSNYGACREESFKFKNLPGVRGLAVADGTRLRLGGKEYTLDLKGRGVGVDSNYISAAGVIDSLSQLSRTRPGASAQVEILDGVWLDFGHEVDTDVSSSPAGSLFQTMTAIEDKYGKATAEEVASQQLDLLHSKAKNLNSRRKARSRLACLDKFLSDDYLDTRISIVTNSNTPAEVLTTLSVDSHEEVRSQVAYNSNTPAKVLTTLATDSSDYVRSSVAQNYNTPAELLTTLASDSDVHVRITVTRNPNTPAKVLTILAHNLDENIRISVAENFNPA